MGTLYFEVGHMIVELISFQSQTRGTTRYILLDSILIDYHLADKHHCVFMR